MVDDHTRCRKKIVLLVLIGCAFYVVWNAEAFVVGKQQDDAVLKVSLTRPEFCQDPNAKPCRCTDPSISISREGPNWMLHHERMVSDTPPANLDLVMIGDSLIENWNGTSKPAQRQLFEGLFTFKGGGSLEGMALGSGGDTSPNVLWHLQNGLADKLHPKVWLVLVGTNDLVSRGCSPQATVDGILQVARYLSQHGPTAAIIIHGLLPRGEGRTQAMVLGLNWNRIQTVNQQLYDESHAAGWYYMDTGDLFLRNATLLHSRLIGDGIHPRILGMKLWGPQIVQTVKAIIENG